MSVLPSSQVYASVAANTAHYEAALQQLDAALQAPVERQYEIERSLYALLSKVATLKVEHGVELPLAAAEHLLIRTEEEEFIQSQQSAVAEEEAALRGKIVTIYEAVHRATLEMRRALLLDANYQDMKARQSQEARAHHETVAQAEAERSRCQDADLRDQQNRIVGYLASVQYGEPGYAVRGVSKLGDHLFALLCRYPRVRRNRKRLRELEEELEQAQRPADQRHVQLQEWLHSMEAVAGKSAGIDALLDQIADVEQEIAQRQRQSDTLKTQLAAHQGNSDYHFQQAHDLTMEFMHALPDAVLLQTIRRLPGGFGAAHAMEWQRLRSELKSLRSRYGNAFTRRGRAAKDRDRARALEIRILSACDARYGFRPALPLNNLMSGYMAGNISEDEVVRQINAHRIEFGAAHNASAQ
ncbi:hypothetical protein [Noviherbaspirillum pedocola]|uniref:Uncharacterized protein n=1 Tax=Noviherbaspirillum pedocola TaxID=2801341 RepID=A0A934SVJ0_9BURK|nr:hypothetical protein [Noviherbaspirillum pedocola]MBK4735921.1 hypothetical protein [Noviherbaspirillum pedocola]